MHLSEVEQNGGFINMGIVKAFLYAVCAMCIFAVLIGIPCVIAALVAGHFGLSIEAAKLLAGGILLLFVLTTLFFGN